MKRKQAIHPGQLVAESVCYYSQKDERSFLKWLLSIRCVSGIHGRGNALSICLKHAPKDQDLRELLGLFYRYGVDMRQLAAFVTDENESWFRNRQKYWFKQVFPAHKRKTPGARPGRHRARLTPSRTTV